MAPRKVASSHSTFFGLMKVLSGTFFNVPHPLRAGLSWNIATGALLVASTRNHYRWYRLMKVHCIVTCLSIIFFAYGPPRAVADEPKDNDKRLQEVVANVRASEQLYRNIEVRIRQTYETAKSDPTPFDFKYKSYAKEYRFVGQNGLHYVRFDLVGEGMDGRRIEDHPVQGYDGEFTRNERNKIVNIRQGCDEPPMLFAPHRWLFELPVPLSLWLAGGEALRKHPYAGQYSNSELRVSMQGEEKFNDLLCWKLRCEQWSMAKTPVFGWVYVLWLAPERNWLPVKEEGFQPCDPVNPVVRCVADDFRELSPGVWLPFRKSEQMWDAYEIRVNKKVFLEHESKAVVEYARLDPNYAVALFREVPIPPGAAVYEVNKDGRITKSYFAPGGKGQERPNQGTSFLGYGLVALLFVAIVLLGWSAYLVIQRQRARRQLTQPAVQPQP